jgi:mycothiol synthase
VDVLRAPDGGVADAVEALADAVSAREGRTALREEQREALRRGGPRWAGVVASDGGRVVGYAGVLGEGQAWAVEYVATGGPHTDVAAAVVAAALDVISAAGGGPVLLWRSAPDAGSEAVAAGAGLRAERDLLQVRRPLPVGEPWSLAVRPFVPGRDEEAWLAVNNRAFAGHPEQGGWDRQALARREGEPWFDPAGFLLHEEGARLAGFCWTKVHADGTPPLGEIYVIAVDPDFGGRGLGRRLVLAGLDHLAGKGLAVGMLYVDSDNAPARALYDRLGFTLHHIDRGYVGSVSPSR